MNQRRAEIVGLLKSLLAAVPCDDPLLEENCIRMLSKEEVFTRIQQGQLLTVSRGMVEAIIGELEKPAE